MIPSSWPVERPPLGWSSYVWTFCPSLLYAHPENMQSSRRPFHAQNVPLCLPTIFVLFECDIFRFQLLIISWSFVFVLQFVLPFLVNQCGSILFYFTLSSTGIFSIFLPLDRYKKKFTNSWIIPFRAFSPFATIVRLMLPILSRRRERDAYE